ncbi:Anoctamin-4 [Desmophyllum pertusum]|uniref:Anoctamin-4 n=1 Tax=Desmophyllum pertusum TaxID=174260 RepID=A0A9W9YGM9_9CNID|nr:Anoctamin-4 [Desmophyllum pertusum]
MPDITYRSTEQKRFISSDPISRATSGDKLNETSELPASKSFDDGRRNTFTGQGKESPIPPHGNKLLNKKIDYVLVYSEPEKEKENDEEEMEKAEMREKYEENLRKQGLMVEHVASDEQENVVFVLIHAPWDVLTKCAEEMMIRVPVREHKAETHIQSSSKNRWLKKAKNVLNIFQLQEDPAMKTERQVTAFFSRAKSSCFLIEDEETFFSDIDRSRMTHRLLLSTKYSSENGRLRDLSAALQRGLHGRVSLAR